MMKLINVYKKRINKWKLYIYLDISHPCVGKYWYVADTKNKYLYTTNRHSNSDKWICLVTTGTSLFFFGVFLLLNK